MFEVNAILLFWSEVTPFLFNKAPSYESVYVVPERVMVSDASFETAPRMLLMKARMISNVAFCDVRSPPR